ncbi:MAG TPA: YciI family protein [Stellaceae bacterium]|nr:YciI family protein [Stellaceae bacterium]
MATLSRVMAAAAHDAQLEPMMEDTMKYMLLIYRDEADMQAASKAQIEQTMGAYLAYTEALRKAGVIVGGDRLQPSTAATTVRLLDGKSKVLDGPYAETKEQLGGYYMIDVPDLDAALSWAARCPGAGHGTIEVRPLWVM